MSCTQPAQAPETTAVLQVWSNDVDKITEQCQKEGRLADICWVHAVTLLAAVKRYSEAKTICKKRSGVWQEECFFRLAEELAKHGEIVPAVKQCDKVRTFKYNCLPHVTNATPTGREDMLRRKKLYQKLGKWEEFDTVANAFENIEERNLLLLLTAWEKPRYES